MAVDLGSGSVYDTFFGDVLYYKIIDIVFSY